MSHKYDILVMGASGFTGQLVCKYLASQASVQNFTWAAGGRNREKIEQKMKEVHAEPSEIFIADSKDEDALRRAVKQVKVVISLIGPYLLHGEALVKVCAEEGTSYCDLTGETPFIHKMIQKYQRTALDTKAVIMHTSGVDSIPSDIGAFLAVQQLKQVGGEQTLAGNVRSSFKAKGGMSGGTLLSLLEVVEQPKETRDVATKTYGLSPITGKHSGRPVVVSSHTYAGKRTWGGFFLMAPVNIPIVHRSWGILENADPSSRVLRYGPNFVYDEMMALPGPISSFVASSVMLMAFGAIALFSPFRWLLRRFGPQSGDGPSEQERENGWYETTTVAKSDDGKYESRVIQKAQGDPGYAATSILISTCAICLVKDHDRLAPIAKHGGFLTPSVSLGNLLVERLEKTGRFSFTKEGRRITDKKAE
ncbi:hypothetical protein BMF94_5696 [Rhodotorula taiwanensis]|uniref:Saccharopine dehydrogenase NADP binding domain-containing protein n=1 Tax=Rhodotorula taiwanensis TaxID=741276 RepID=A0A2S5B3L7_9BASI|nr:hypothetical protein BMF94_5696 [Rhodotorula taiwanensis]